jgi:hypothetical protein
VDANFAIPQVNYLFNVNGTPNLQPQQANSAGFDLTDTGISNIFALFDQRSVATSEQIAWRGDVPTNSTLALSGF